MGMEGGEEWAEVEMWTEVVECRLRGAEPLIDCSGLTVALCDCHFKHTPTVYFYSCEGLLLLSLTLTLILAETLYKFLILEVQTKNFDSGISYEFGSFKPTTVCSCSGKCKNVTARTRKQIAHYPNCIQYFIRNISERSFLSLDTKLHLDAFFISVMHIYKSCYFKSKYQYKGKKVLTDFFWSL